MKLTSDQKQRVVSLFVGGKSLADIATFMGVHHATIETTLRQAITGLVKLNDQLLKKTQPEPEVHLV